MKIFITGNQGFIGTHLFKSLEEDGHKVLGYDLKSGLDIRNVKQLQFAIKRFRPDIVIHLAALAGVRVSYEIPNQYYETNIIGTSNVLEVSRQFGVKKVLVASSSTVYGNQKCPLKEEDAPGIAVSPYGVSKIAVENVCGLFPDLPIIIFRPFTVYGDNGRDNMVIKTIIKAGSGNKVFTQYGDGTSKRGYTHVLDLVDGIKKLMNHKPENNLEVFNLGGVEIITLQELVTLAKTYFPFLKVKVIKDQQGDVKESYANINKAKSKVNFLPSHNFKEEFIKLCQH